MDTELQRRLSEIPEDPPRSRLEPYRDIILRWRRQGRSYRRIRQLLNDECQVKVADMTLHEFVKRRSRPRKAQTEPELEQPTIPSAVRDRSQRATLPTGNDPYTEARERMRRHKEEPTVLSKPHRRFEYTEQDSIDPIVLLPKTEKEK